MVTFDITSCIDKFYTYRTALLQASIWISLDTDERRKIHNYLMRQGYKPDNHICWRNKDGMCFALDDGSLGLGLDILEGKY
jgi:hypothetical protein